MVASRNEAYEDCGPGSVYRGWDQKILDQVNGEAHYVRRARREGAVFPLPLLLPALPVTAIAKTAVAAQEKMMAEAMAIKMTMG